jgi:hypothetical protein
VFLAPGTASAKALSWDHEKAGTEWLKGGDSREKGGS